MIERDDSIRATVHGCLEHHFISSIHQLRTPLVVHLNRDNHVKDRVQKVANIPFTRVRGESVLRQRYYYPLQGHIHLRENLFNQPFSRSRI